MPIHPRPVIVLLALAASVTSPALAQSGATSQSRSLAPRGAAAATLPNSFDGPAVPPAVSPALPAVPGGQVTEAQMAEAALRTVIGQLQAGTIDEALFTEALGGQMKDQLASVSPMVEAFGALRTIEPQGARNGAGQYQVTFENAVTQWVIGLEEGGLISALLFRPAPPESSEPAAPPAG